MNSRATILLLGAVLLLGGLAVWDHQRGTPTERAQQQSRRIVKINTADITRIELALTNMNLVVEKAGARWEIKEPVSTRADTEAINAILAGVEFADKLRTFTAAELRTIKLAEFGLLAPRARVTLRGAGQPAVLSLGDETPTKDAIYVMVEGVSEVYVTPKSLADRIIRRVVELRDRVVLDVDPAIAVRVEIKSAERVLELGKSSPAGGGEPRWGLVRPVVTRADQRKVADLLSDLAALRIAEFISDDPKDVHAFRLSEPAREISITRSGSELPLTLLLSAPATNGAGTVYGKLKNSDSIFTVPVESLRRLEVPVAELRDRQLLAFEPATIRQLELQRGAERLVVGRNADRWGVTSPVTQPAEETEVLGVLAQLRGLRASQFVADVATDLEQFGLAVPAVIVRLQGEGTNLVGQLLIGAADSSNAVRYVKRESEPFIYGVDARLIDALPASHWAFRSRYVTDLQPAAITKLTVESAAGTVRVERDAEQKWRLIEPAQGALNTDEINQLLAVVASLQVEEFYSVVPSALNQPDYTLTLTAGEKTYRLKLAQQAGQWSDPELSFRLPAAAAAALRREFFRGAASP